MAIACPTRLQGAIAGMYYFDAQNCGTGGTITANDTRDHTLGVNCANVLDPIFIPDPIPVPGDPPLGTFGCGCAYTGLKSYTTLQSTFMLAPGFDISAEHVVQYVDENDDGQSVERLARVFLLSGEGPKRKP